MVPEPVSLADIKERLFAGAKPGHCVSCSEPFVRGKNVHTNAGERETKLSRMCEDCFDEMCRQAELEDEEE